MEIILAKQIQSEQLQSQHFDFIICVSGFESRASQIIDYLNGINFTSTRKVCYCFPDRISLSRDTNDKRFKEFEFEMQNFESNELSEWLDIYDALFKNSNKEKISVLVDFSCMSKIQYASILKYFELNRCSFKSVRIIFHYTQAKFSIPPDFLPNLHFDPIPLFPSVEFTDKKVALIVGLGYEEDKAQGLIEFLQINFEDIYLFSTSIDSNKDFHEIVKKNNSYLFNSIPKKNQIEYEVNNLTKTFNMLESLTNYLLSKSFRVILAPIGPKVFTLISLLLNMKHRNISVLRVSDGTNGQALDKQADLTQSPLLLEVQFQEQDYI